MQLSGQQSGSVGAGSEDRTAIATQICDELGAELSDLASAFVGQCHDTVEIVAEVISSHLLSDHHQASLSVRRAALSRDLYRRCRSSEDRVAQHQGEIALALIRSGRLTYREVAGVMELPEWTVAAMLRAVLMSGSTHRTGGHLAVNASSATGHGFS
ncbi:hypothetical protein [Kribbella sp. NPDC051770]|uniref:hypothetical protein n=1 Tax=Kribbella sp. NPDC051770 TaxID=3155413 RepID=UPI00342A1BA3